MKNPSINAMMSSRAIPSPRWHFPLSISIKAVTAARPRKLRCRRRCRARCARCGWAGVLGVGEQVQESGCNSLKTREAVPRACCSARVDSTPRGAAVTKRRCVSARERYRACVNPCEFEVDRSSRGVRVRGLEYVAVIRACWT